MVVHLRRRHTRLSIDVNRCARNIICNRIEDVIDRSVYHRILPLGDRGSYRSRWLLLGGVPYIFRWCCFTVELFAPMFESRWIGTDGDDVFSRYSVCVLHMQRRYYPRNGPMQWRLIIGRFMRPMDVEVTSSRTRERNRRTPVVVVVYCLFFYFFCLARLNL